MKKYFASFVAIISLTTFTSSAHAERVANEERLVLSLIDAQCGDSWCERADVSEFTFEALTCVQGRSCELFYTVEMVDQGGRSQMSQKSCQLKHVKSLEDAWGHIGLTPILTSAMMADLNSCLSWMGSAN